MRLTRRHLLKIAAGAGTFAMQGLAAHQNCHAAQNAFGSQPSNTSWSPALPEKLTKLPIPPLFVTAYITPSAPGQGGQEPLVARYPMALVPQDSRIEFQRWRDKVKSINPDIRLLGYQMVCEETTVPGPGHDKYRTLNAPYITYPNGRVPAVGPSHKRRRLFDLRKAEWRDAFLEGCLATMRSYPFDGLFLDNCTVFPKHHPVSSVRDEMRDALQHALSQLRSTLPKSILIGNARENWTGLNGEMNEGRRRDVADEVASYRGHAAPEMDLVTTILKSPEDTATVRREMTAALRRGALYGAAVNYQHVLWFDEFDEVIAAYNDARS